MSLLVYVVLTKIALTFGLSLVYLYLYRQYKEKYIALWFTSWSLLAVHVFLDLLRIKGVENLFLLLLNQVISILSIWFLLKGTYSFKGEKTPNFWIYSAIIATFLSDISFLFQLPFYLCAIPTTLFFAIADMFVGVSFIRCWVIPGAGRLITGYTFILLGILNSTYPAAEFLPGQFSMYGYFLGSFFEMIIIIGTLILYFQKIRKELSESEERFRLLAENSKDIIFRYNIIPSPGFEYISPAVYSVTGYSPEELHINPELLFKMIGSEQYKNLVGIFKGIQESPNSVNQICKFVLTHKQGEKIWLEQQNMLIYDKLNQVIAIEGIARDITERVRVEQEMSRLNQLRILGETAASIAHEIRNPMTVIRGYLSNLVGKEALKSYSEHFNLMIEELDRANEIMSDYLSFSRINEFVPKPQNLNQIIQTLLPLIKSSAANCMVELHLELGLIPDLLVDERQIRQLVINLVNNALESMTKSGRISVNTFMKNNKVILAVTDEGRGIDEEIMERIGTPFFTTKEKGTGLGLAVCYRIAELHNAKICINTGCTGTAFSIEFNSY